MGCGGRYVELVDGCFLNWNFMGFQFNFRILESGVTSKDLIWIFSGEKKLTDGGFRISRKALFRGGMG